MLLGLSLAIYVLKYVLTFYMPLVKAHLENMSTNSLLPKHFLPNMHSIFYFYMVGKAIRILCVGGSDIQFRASLEFRSQRDGAIFILFPKGRLIKNIEISFAFDQQNWGKNSKSPLAPLAPPPF